MISKENVLAIRPEATLASWKLVHMKGVTNYFAIVDSEFEILSYEPTESGAWAAAYKYLTK